MNVGACSLRLWIGLVSTLIFISIYYFCDSGAQAISLPRIEEIDDNRYWAIAGDLDIFFRNITSN
jgi:hypothetical protein